MKLTAEQVENIIYEAGINASLFHISDYDWQRCSIDFVYDNWSAWVASLPAELVFFVDGKKYPKWIKECFDCENHSIGTMQHAQIGNALKAVRGGWERGGLLYGMLYYMATPKPDNNRIGGHAINWFIDHNNDMQFFEPADNLIINLTTKERASVWTGICG